MDERIILDGEGIERAMALLTQQILTRWPRAQGLALVGIKTRGEFLARRMASRLEASLGREVPVGAMDISFYRDDFSIRRKAPPGETRLNFDILGVEIVLVDDVLFTGRTTRAALDQLADLGRASSVSLAVLVDRGHRELPIKADFVGATIETDRDQVVKARLRELDGVDQVVTFVSRDHSTAPSRRRPSG